MGSGSPREFFIKRILGFFKRNTSIITRSVFKVSPAIITCPAINYRSNTRITGVISAPGLNSPTLKSGFSFPIT